MPAPSDHPATKMRRWLRQVTAVLCGTFLLALCLVTVIDVVGRYLLASPLPGGAEYTEILLMAIIFMGLPAVCLDDGHISVDLFTSKLTGRWAMLQTTMARLVIAVMLAIISWQLWKHAAQLASYNEVTVYLRTPIAPFARATAVIAGACSLLTFIMAFTRLPKGQSGGL